MTLLKTSSPLYASLLTILACILFLIPRRKAKTTQINIVLQNDKCLTPPYLSSLVPPRVGDTSSYSLRNSNQYQTIDTKSQLYYNSFLPSAVREWNALDSESQSCLSVPSFKRSI